MLTIAKLAAQAGVGVETVRYYQRRGLMAVPAPASGAVRRYGSDDMKRLRFIRAAQAAGFTLDEIAELLALDGTADRPRARALAQERVTRLDAQIATLTEARNALSRLAQACAAADGGACPIIAAFEG